MIPSCNRTNHCTRPPVVRSSLGRQVSLVLCVQARSVSEIESFQMQSNRKNVVEIRLSFLSAICNISSFSSLQVLADSLLLALLSFFAPQVLAARFVSIFPFRRRASTCSAALRRLRSHFLVWVCAHSQARVLSAGKARGFGGANIAAQSLKLATQQGAAPDRLQLHSLRSFLTSVISLPAAGELVVMAQCEYVFGSLGHLPFQRLAFPASTCVGASAVPARFLAC